MTGLGHHLEGLGRFFRLTGHGEIAIAGVKIGNLSRKSARKSVKYEREDASESEKWDIESATRFHDF